MTTEIVAQPLFNLTTQTINTETVDTVNARELHAFLGVKSEFRNWIKNRIEQFWFVQDTDFIAGNFLPGSDQTDYYLTITMAKELAMVERNEKGKEARQYFIECERRLKAVALPQTYLEALKALVVVEEEKQRALAHSRALEQQIETDKPYTDLARAITGQSTMTRRDWLALMKDDSGVNVTERALTAWLINTGYCYRDQLSRELRAYASFSHFFKLEVEVINGYPRRLLKVTGDGMFNLTPLVVAAFAAEVV